ncbi:hypothetical protein pRL100113 (plasmid) [Rhizobium johnstonii 3841]|uniref:Uncharacterized protein n=1 Tax=Rhizobium johnstonii (strain DSM 114642 / LMG 32736 / 3841) TaxID=216596 RepID=Q1M833_RHIJ3|nr:hypothetical protein pRL100113 [Rhizobium johnstonii 3841]
MSQIPPAAVMRRTARVSCFANLLQSERRCRCSSRSEASPRRTAEPRKFASMRSDYNPRKLNEVTTAASSMERAKFVGGIFLLARLSGLSMT